MPFNALPSIAKLSSRSRIAFVFEYAIEKILFYASLLLATQVKTYSDDNKSLENVMNYANLFI